MAIAPSSQIDTHTHTHTRTQTRHQMNRRVLELGCGCALPSIVAAQMGAKVVVATDRSTVLGCAERNVALSRRRFEADGAMTFGVPIAVQALDWTDPEELNRVAMMSHSDSGHGLDPHDVQGDDDHFDLIMGADLVYDEQVFDALVAVLERLTGPHTVILLAGKRRYVACALHFIGLIHAHMNS